MNVASNKLKNNKPSENVARIRENLARLDAIVTAAKKAIGEMPGVSICRMCYMYFDTVDFSPEVVMLQIEPKNIKGLDKAPKVCNYRSQGPGYVEAYKADYKAWKVEADEAASSLFDAATKKLRRAKIKYSPSRVAYSKWPAAKLS